MTQHTHTTIYLVRHGEVYNPEEIMYGRIPGYRLSEIGQQQAQAAATYLRDKSLVALFASPQQRAQETAGFIGAEHPSLVVQTDERLNEVHVPYEGRPHAELEAMGWDLYTGNQPPFETPTNVLARMRSFFKEVRAAYAGKSVAAVSHGDIMVFSFLYAKGLDVESIVKRDLPTHGHPERYPVTASVNILTFATDDENEIPGYHYHRPY